MIKAIIYDLDDLMVNTLPQHTAAWNVLLKKYGRSFEELPEKTVATFIGRRVYDITQEVIDGLKLNVSADEFYRQRSEIFLQLVRASVEPMPGLQKSLDLFKNNGLKIAIASSGTREYIKTVLDKLKIKKYFDVVITGDDVKVGKPDPETYLTAAKKLNLPPRECLVLEDATNGIAAAKAADCYCLGIYNPHTPPQDRSAADKILNSLEDITLKMVRSF